MALEGIAGLPVAIGLTGAEDVPIVQGGTTKRTTTQGIADLAAGSVQAILDAISSTQGAILYRNASDWVGLSPSTAGYVLTTQGVGADPTWDANLAADITIGTSIVTGGTNTRILYNNSGVVGEYTTTGTGTVVAMQTAPTFLTFASMPRLLMTQAAITADAPQISALATWNNAAVPFTAWKLNVTNTASDAASLFLDFQLGGSSQFYVMRNGQLGLHSGQISVGSGGSLQINSDNQNDLRDISARVTGGQTLALLTGITADTFLERDAANIIAQRNGTNEQSFKLYNSFTNDSNYSRLAFNWGGGIAFIKTEGAGTGFQRNIIIDGALVNLATSGTSRWQVDANGNLLAFTDNTYDIGASGATRPKTGYFGTSVITPVATITQGTITANAPQLSGTVTWNNAAVAFTGWKLNVTDTASDAASLLLNIGLSGGSRLTLTKDGSFKVGDVDTALGDTGQLYFNSPNADIRLFAPGGTMKLRFGFGSQSILMPTDGLLGWGVPASVSPDLQLARDAADTLAQRNGTNAQMLRVYKTYTDASTYERLTLGWDGSVYRVGSDNAGVGTTGRQLNLAGSVIQFEVAGVNKWQMDGSANLIANTDNAYDIGASGANRPRTLFLGTGGVDSAGNIGSLGSVTAGAGSIFYFAGRTTMSSPADGNLLFQNTAGSDFGRLMFGGTTSSFPAIKRSSTALHARLADDSAYAPFSAELTTLAAGTATPANGSSAARVLLGTTANFGVYYGSGAPTGLSAAQGSLYLRSDGTGVNDRAYINSSSGSGTTWTAIVTVG